jgi:peptidyl-prolyl cis-trans isomerase SurA
MKKQFIVLTTFIFVSWLATIQASEVKIFDRIVAVVNGDVILNSELNRSMNNFKQQLLKAKSQLPPEDIFRKQVLERLITDNLQLQMARRAGVRVSDGELNATVTKIAQSANMSIEQFKQRIEEEGDNYTLFREEIRKEIMVNRVRQGQVGRRVFISDQEVQNLVELINEQGQSNSKFHLGHILVSIPETATVEEVTKAREKAEKIVADLRQGADFKKLAITSSDGQNALSGGDFGWKSLAELPSLFAGVSKSLKVGEVSEPLRSASGLHILQLHEIKGVEKQTLVNQVNSRHILIKPSKIMNEVQAKKLLTDLRERVLAGEDFETLAKEYSDDLGSGSLGGNLDWSDPNIFTPKFKEVLLNLKKDEISQPFRSQFGWHIVQLLGTRVSDETIAARTETARRILFNRKFDEEVNNWLREIRTEAYVKVL